jgi:diguanylate cyclase (GGDEF)-like protein
VSAWRAWLAIALTLALVYLTLPAAAQDVLYALVAVAAPVAIVIGILRYRPTQRAWALMGLAAGLMAAGEVTWLARAAGVIEASVAHPLYLLAYLVLFGAVTGLARRRRSSLSSILDAAIIAVAAGSVLWVAISGPLFAGTPLGGAGVLVTTIYPLADVVILGLMARLVADRRRVTPAATMLAAGVACFLVSDLAWSLLLIEGRYTNGVFDLGWLAGYALWAAAALHPSMSVTGERDQAPAGIADRRLTALATVSVVPVLMAFLDQVRRGDLDPRPTVVVSAVMFLLVVLRLIDLVRDQRALIEERVRIQGTLERLSVEDALTGLVNRRGFGALLSEALARSPASTTVMLVDLDDFKLVNDSHGHGAGDAVLVAVAQRLRAAVRAGDTVARLGGDEFALLLTESPGPDTALLIADRVVTIVREPLQVGETQVQVGVSVGIAMPGPSGADAETLMRNADLALYRAKERPARPIELYDEDLHRQTVRSLVLRNDLSVAVAHGELSLRFQPIVDLGTGRPCALEALVRWRHPQLGTLSPAEFMPIAESSGAVTDIGRWVLREACRLAAGWQDVDQALRINVNLAPSQLRLERLVDDVREAMGGSGIDPSRLVLEVTEATLDLGPGVRERLEELAAAGVGLAIDDFGTGYSSLARVGELQVDELKVDRSLLGSERRFLGAVRIFGSSLGMRVVMEGVQTRRELGLVRELGFDAAQGYALGRPMDAGAVPAWVARASRPAAALAATAPVGA